MEHYDAIVIGTGGIGSAALHELARRGVKALGLDRFPPGHDRGSSHGDTRIIRLAYMEHPDYVPLLRRTYELWKQLEKTRGEILLTATGLLQAGPAGGSILEGVLRSSREHGLDIEELDAQEAARRFPGIRLPSYMRAIYEEGAGSLAVESCVLAYIDEAEKLGATTRCDETVLSWHAEGDGVRVTTSRTTYDAGRLIITAGAWAGDLLADLQIPIEIRRKPLFWFEAATDTYDATKGFPAFFFETPDGVFYGFPAFESGVIKVAEHSGGDLVEDPLHVDRELRKEDQERLEQFLLVHLPSVNFHVLRHAVCMYSVTPDEHFIVDRHPEYPQVAFAAGLSGHGFKFAAVLGEVLTDLAIDGKTSTPIEFLGCQRPALRGPLEGR